MDLKIIMESLNFSSILWQVLTPILFSVADVITGFIQAVINNNVDTTKMRKGLLHKVLIILVLFLSFVLDATFNLNFCSKAVSVYIIVMEVLSIAENLTKAGVKMGKLSEILKVGRSENDETK